MYKRLVGDRVSTSVDWNRDTESWRHLLPGLGRGKSKGQSKFDLKSVVNTADDEVDDDGGSIVDPKLFFDIFGICR